MTYLLDSIYAIEVPENLLMPEFDIEKTIYGIMNNKSEYELIIRHTERKCGSPIGKIAVLLPPGSYKILFTTKKCSREQAKSVVDGTVIYELMDVKDYNVVFNYLLSQRNLDPGKNYILIKRKI